jgi:hypothetical protein
MKYLIFCLVLISINTHAAFIVKQTIENGKITVESVSIAKLNITNKTKLKSLRESISEKSKTREIIFEEIAYPENQLPENLKKFLNTKEAPVFFPGSEVRKIVGTGEDSNRITITILGDGYTLSEKQKYFDDVNRIVDDMFKEVTFKSYLPVFNIYAVFTPSQDSGITDLKSKRTAFDLYRSPRGSKRGVMPGNRSAIESALKLIGEHTDYPIIIANDDFYGGLGGRYAITTRSLTSGSMVLRHELGHNFSNVGEEYDGGQVYSGANFSSSKSVPWKHWVNSSDGKVHVHEAKFLTGSYVWQDLGKEDFELDFNFPKGAGFTYDLKLSSVGWSSDNDVKVLLDGKELDPKGVYTKDRSFFRTKRVPISEGKHTLKVLDNNRDGDNVLAFANGYAYPASYDFTPGLVGAFNVFADGGRARGYRPTDNQCLMRDMRSKIFCAVDQENIWLRFLKRISLIDSVKEVNGVHTVKTLELDGISTKWFKIEKRSKRVELTQFQNLRSANLNNLGKGKYEVEVNFKSSEIRVKTDVTTDVREIKIK